LRQDMHVGGNEIRRQHGLEQIERDIGLLHAGQLRAQTRPLLR
jgi:hypothetical protein